MEESNKKTGFRTPLKFLSITRTSSDSKAPVSRLSRQGLGKRLSIPLVMSQTKGTNFQNIEETKDDIDQVKYRNVKVTTPTRPLSVCIPGSDPKTRWRSHTTDMRYPLLGQMKSEGSINSPVDRDVNSNISDKEKSGIQNLLTEDKRFRNNLDLQSGSYEVKDKINTDTGKEVEKLNDVVLNEQKLSDCTEDLLSIEKRTKHETLVQNSVSIDTSRKTVSNKREEYGDKNQNNNSDNTKTDNPIFYGVLPVCSKEKAITLHPKREITKEEITQFNNNSKDLSKERKFMDNKEISQQSLGSEVESRPVAEVYDHMEVLSRNSDKLLPPEISQPSLGSEVESRPVAEVYDHMEVLSRNSDKLLPPEMDKNFIEGNKGNISKENFGLETSSKRKSNFESELKTNSTVESGMKEKTTSESGLKNNSTHESGSKGNSILESVLIAGNSKINSTDLSADFPEQKESKTSQKDMTLNLTLDCQARSKKVDEPLSPIDSLLTSPTPRPRRRTSRRRYYRPKSLEDDEFIGFASLPEQVHRKAVRRGFDFSLMVLGDSGLGKSTLVNSLFLTDLYKDRKIPEVADLIERTVCTEKKQLEIEEKGVKVRLTIVDTPGYNDAVNAEDSWRKVVDYVNQQFELYYKAESGVNRKNIQDSRIHCCLYFISPYGHGLKPLDILVMKQLHTKVNIVPLVAKSDVLTPKEVKRLKERILDDIKKNDINIYTFPECDSDEDEEFKEQDKALKDAVPFAVIGSNTVVEAGGKKIRGRMYPWGIVEVDNPKHCDFVKLRQMLISTHMQDLKDITSEIHYENYRAEHLLSSDVSRTNKERTKLKRDSIANLEKAMETEQLLQEKEAEIQRMQEMLAKMQAQLQNNPSQANGRLGNVR